MEQSVVRPLPWTIWRNMNIAATVSGNSRRTRELALQFMAPIAFLSIVLLLFPYFDGFEFDTDEGINVMKARLLACGYPLYEEIWSDQPPFFTYALAAAFRVFGFEVNVARFLVLILSCMLLWGSWRFLRAVGGNAFAFAGSLLIVLLPHYTKLSISVMVGLPAIAFAVISLSALAIWHQSRTNTWLVVSAFALGLSVLTKVFTGFLAPIFVVGLVVSEFSREGALSWRERLWPATFWILVLAFVTFASLILFVGLANVPQLLETHLAAREMPQFQSFSLENALNNTRAIMLLALLGSLLMLRRKRWLALYPLAWLGTAYLLLLYQAPVWYHQQLLVTIPAAILASCAVGEVMQWIPSLRRPHDFLSGRGLISIIVAIGVISAAMEQAPNTLELFDNQTFHTRSDVKTSSPEYGLVAKMTQYAPETQWVITDWPMYAFRAGLLVPPNLAVISWKRMATGALTEQQVLDTIRERRPEQVLIVRFEWPSIIEHLKEHYRAVYSQFGRTLYLRSDLL